MGALLAVLAEVFEISAVTGLSAEAIISGEAFTTAELLSSHISNLVVYGGLTEAEALAAAEVSAEAFAALQSLSASFPAAFKVLASIEGLSVGTLIAGAATAAALYRPGYDQAIPHTYFNMALQEWFPPLDLDLDYPGMRQLARFINYINPVNWAGDLFHQVGRMMWDQLQRQARRQIAYTTTEVAHRTGTLVSDYLARYFENARWVVTHLPREAYISLDRYYRELPPLNPIQQRAVARRVGIPQPYRYDLYKDYELPQATPGPSTTAMPQSGQSVKRREAPGGAEQRTAPNWMLPLLLGLYGDITPAWAEDIAQIEEEEDGPKKKKPRRASTSTKTNSQRRNRGPRSPNRAR
nr:MAG: Agno [Sheep polyomavirus 1]